MKKNSNQSSLKEAIQELLNAYRLNAGIQQAEVKALWDKMMGPYIEKQTEKLTLENGVLNVKITSAALKNELMMMRSKIVEKLNAELKRDLIREIKIW